MAPFTRARRAGALVPLCLYLVVMAIEFVLMHIHRRTDAAPRARLSQVVGAWWAEVWVALMVLLAPAVSP